MATRVSISIRRQAALASIEESMASLYGEEFQFPRQGKDADLLYAVQLEYIAGFLEAKAANKRRKKAS